MPLWPKSSRDTGQGERDLLLNPIASMFFPRRCDAQDGAKWWGRAFQAEDEKRAEGRDAVGHAGSELIAREGVSAETCS